MLILNNGMCNHHKIKPTKPFEKYTSFQNLYYQIVYIPFCLKHKI